MRAHYFSQVPSNKHIAHNWKDFRMSFESSIFRLFISFPFSWVYTLTLPSNLIPSRICLVVRCSCYSSGAKLRKAILSAHFYAVPNIQSMPIWAEYEWNVISNSNVYSKRFAVCQVFRAQFSTTFTLSYMLEMPNSSRFSVTIMDFMCVINHYCRH